MLLNKKGEVYSFGEGLQGQLGTRQKLIQQYQPTQLHFNSRTEFNEPIARIQASGMNSAAFNEFDNLWLWGGTRYGKLGCSRLTTKTQDVPIYTSFEVVKDKDNIPVSLRPYQDTKDTMRKNKTEYIDRWQSVQWGYDHGLFLDKKGRIFVSGLATHGRLGIFEEETEEKVLFPRYLSEGLPNKRVIEVKAGAQHSMAITKQGELYTWGEGSYQRLGLGYEAATCSTPIQFTPYKVDDVFDNNNVVSASTGKQITSIVM